MTARTIAAFALACAFGSANAAITVDHNTWTSTVTGLDSYLSSITTSGFGNTGERTTYTFALPTDFSASSINLFIDAFEGTTPVDRPNYTVRWTFDYANGYTNGGIAFSSSTASFDSGGSTFSTLSVTPWLSVLSYGSNAGISIAGDTWTLTNLVFKGGKGLNPSPDSSCASFSCMVPFATTGLFTIEVSVAVVPEPQGYALALAGIAIATAATRRRRR